MLALSGYLATEKLDYQLMRQEDAKWIAVEQLTDRLIAVGKPSAPKGCMALRLWYEKPTQQLAAGETDHLEGAGFTFQRWDGLRDFRISAVF